MKTEYKNRLNKENKSANSDIAANIVWHQHKIDQKCRAKQKQQQPILLWFTGLSGSGKSTIAGALESKLVTKGHHTYLLDGDNVRHGLCQDLTFSEQDRNENIRRVGEVAKLMLDAGLIVLSAFISPTQKERDSVRQLFPHGQFIEIYISTPLEICEKRDPKGLYKKARKGEITKFTGISSPYEAPNNPEIIINTKDKKIAEVVNELYQQIISIL